MLEQCVHTGRALAWVTAWAWAWACAFALSQPSPAAAQAVSVAPPAISPASAVPAERDRLDLDLREAVEWVPVRTQDAFGRQFEANIRVTVFRPQGEGPHPLVLISHGRDTETRASAPRPRFEKAARFFVRKGFVVVVPQRIGYGVSAALGDPESSLRCDFPRYGPAIGAAADQILEVARHFQTRSDVDPKRLVLVGQSVGGVSTVAAAARRPDGLVASINFSGGHGGNPKLRPGEPCNPTVLDDLMRQWGERSRQPALWVYTENDQYFSAAHSQRWGRVYTGAGAPLNFRLLPAFGADGHQLFAGAADLWQPLVDAFLAPLGWAQAGQLVAPPPSGFAALTDLAALPLRGASAREDYAKFLQRPSPRAWAISPSGRYGWATGDDAVSRAIGLCQRDTGLACKLYAVDDRVVWAH